MTAYQQRVIEQVRLWAQGTPTHNRVDDECCPDFSCCMPDMFTKDEKKRRKRLLELLGRYGQAQ